MAFEIEASLESYIFKHPTSAQQTNDEWLIICIGITALLLLWAVLPFFRERGISDGKGPQ